MPFHQDNLIWIDLEMTGLYPERDHILEIATIVTDVGLEILAEGPVIAVRQSAESLAAKFWERPTKEEDEAGAKASAEAARAATRAKTVFILTATMQLEEMPSWSCVIRLYVRHLVHIGGRRTDILVENSNC